MAEEDGCEGFANRIWLGYPFQCSVVPIDPGCGIAVGHLGALERGGGAIGRERCS